MIGVGVFKIKFESKFHELVQCSVEEKNWRKDNLLPLFFNNIKIVKVKKTYRHLGIYFDTKGHAMFI